MSYEIYISIKKFVADLDNPKSKPHHPAALPVIRLCAGCGGQIHDQFILRVAPNLEWHPACLRCCECGAFLDETRTCFVRDGRVYCREDYLR